MRRFAITDCKTKTLPNILLFGTFACTWLACNPAQFTANDVVPPLPLSTQVGVNLGYFPPKFTDTSLGVLARQWSAQTVRTGLFHSVLDRWGYHCNLEVFKTYQQKGLQNIVAITGFPGENSRDTTFFCPDQRSQLFMGLYEPIWNGKQVNDANLYAKYVGEIAKTYKGLVKIYEVWNEPDAGLGKGWQQRGSEGNWWQNPPLPCEIALKAPVFHYIRMLRITYEVVKKTDPDALVAVGGLGWPSYLDAICRYTDEPVSGAENDPKYPLKGGAYFDCMSFHAYPHLSARPDSAQKLSSSDIAWERLWEMKAEFKEVLDRHGYNGQVYPKKQWICSEFNLPRTTTSASKCDNSEPAQVNFVLKTLVAAHAEGMAQMHLFSLADEVSHENEFAQMGLFHNLSDTMSSQPIPHAAAWAFKSASMLLENAQHDPSTTQKLNLPDGLRGYAFKDGFGQEMLVLWAAKSSDENETPALEYLLPDDLAEKKWESSDWEYSRSGQIRQIYSRNIKLSSSPLFLRPIIQQSKK